MSAGVAVDAVVALLLAATCCYCFLLNRRLKAVKDGQAAMTAAITAFDVATRLAQTNLSRMETEGRSSAAELNRVMGKANALVGELSVMVSAGDHIASRIEGAVADVRILGGRTRRGGLQ